MNELTQQFTAHLSKYRDLLNDSTEFIDSLPADLDWLSLKAAVAKFAAEAEITGVGRDEFSRLMGDLLEVYRRQHQTRFNHRVACLGPEGSYSSVAAKKVFGDAEYEFRSDIQQVFELVASRDVRYGVIAVENSTHGVVSGCIDLLVEHGLSICGEARLTINHALLARGDLSDIETVYSHWQALGQCRRNLRDLRQQQVERGKQLNEVVVESTTTGVQKVLADDSNTTAAIANPAAAEGKDIRVLVPSISDENFNATRFFVITRDEPTASEMLEVPCRTSIWFQVRHQKGALCDALAALRDLNLNVIYSRPDPSGPWAYSFYIEFEGHCMADDVHAALEDVRELCGHDSLRILGSYPVDEA